MGPRVVVVVHESLQVLAALVTVAKLAPPVPLRHEGTVDPFGLPVRAGRVWSREPLLDPVASAGGDEGVVLPSAVFRSIVRIGREHPEGHGVSGFFQMDRGAVLGFIWENVGDEPAGMVVNGHVKLLSGHRDRLSGK